MSIAMPYSGIKNFKTVPVDCTKCDWYGNLTDLPGEAKRALIDSTVFHKHEEERLTALSENREPRAFVKSNSKPLLVILEQKNISCEKCGSLLVVPQSFYQMVGGYEDDIAHERSWRWKKGLMRLDGEGKLTES